MAEKQINLTIREPVLADVDALTIARDPDNPASLIMVAQYTLHETDGDAFATRTAQLPLSTSQKATLVSYVEGTILPMIKEAEGPFED